MKIRSEPFRLLFAIAAALGVIGVGHFVLFAMGITAISLGAFHAVTQTESFLLAFAAGFLMTAVPKRTGTRPATALEIGSVTVCILAVPAAKLAGLAWLAHAFYVIALSLLARFATARFAARLGTPEGASRRPPASFVLVVIALVSGVLGGTIQAAAELTSTPRSLVWLGRTLTTQGVFVLLCLGVGAFFLPLANRGEKAADLARDPASMRALARYGAAGLAIVATFVIEAAGQVREGELARGAVSAAVLIGSGALGRPTKPGLHRRLLVVAMACLPLGFALASLFPAARVAMLHVTFIGGFATLAFAVATHVTLGHGGFEDELTRAPAPIVALAAALALALALRVAALGAPDGTSRPLAAAAAIWVTGVLVWAAFTVPKMLRAAPKSG